MTEYRMIQDWPNTRPTPEERIAEARRVFQARYGREPQRLLAHPTQAVGGAEACVTVGQGVVWCQVEGEAK
jgi:hypothetical protein